MIHQFFFRAGMRPDLVLDEDDKRKRFKKYKDDQINIENCDRQPVIEINSGRNNKRKFSSYDETGLGVRV